MAEDGSSSQQFDLAFKLSRSPLVIVVQKRYKAAAADRDAAIASYRDSQIDLTD
jgi:hypothetical protein